MKILYVAPDYPNKNENAAQVRANQILPILGCNIDLHVLGFCHEADSNKDYKGVNTKIINTSNADWVSTISFKPRAFYRYRFKKSVEILHSMINEFRPDVIHFDSIATFGLFESLTSFEVKQKPKIVLHSHDSVTRLYTNRFQDEKRIIKRIDLWLQLQKIKNIEKRLYPHADICLVDSHEDAEFLNKLSKRTNVKVLPLGFNEDEYCADGNKTELLHPNVIFSGAMGSIQSAEAAIFLCDHIMPLVWKSMPDMTVYLVGGNPSQEVLALAEADKRIVVTGFVHSLAEYLRSADVYVCPLRLGSGMRTRVIEALACGSAMVASHEAIVGLYESNESNPWVLCDKASDFAECIFRLHNEDNMRIDLGARAAAYAKESYSWSRVVSELIDTYKSLLK